MILYQKTVYEIREELKKNNKVMPCSYDVIFKTIMITCPNYLADLLSRIINVDKSLILKTLVIKNTEYNVSNALERKKTSDFIFSINNHAINIEFNGGYYDGLIERNEAYLGKIKGELLNKGEDYTSKYKIIQININNFKHVDSDKVGYVFKLRDDNLLVETESSVKYHFNLDKIERKYKNKEKLTKLEKELLILILEDIPDIKNISKGDDELMEVANKLYDLTDDIGKIGLYDREKHIREQSEMMARYREKQGLNKGLSKGKKIVAKNLLEMNLSIDDIVKATGLSKEQVINLK